VEGNIGNTEKTPLTPVYFHLVGDVYIGLTETTSTPQSAHSPGIQGVVPARGLAEEHTLCNGLGHPGAPGSRNHRRTGCKANAFTTRGDTSLGKGHFSARRKPH
jgi:hypothetical protein